MARSSLNEEQLISCGAAGVGRPICTRLAGALREVELSRALSSNAESSPSICDDCTGHSARQERDLTRRLRRRIHSPSSSSGVIQTLLRTLIDHSGRQPLTPFLGRSTAGSGCRPQGRLRRPLCPPQSEGLTRKGSQPAGVFPARTATNPPAQSRRKARFRPCPAATPKHLHAQRRKTSRAAFTVPEANDDV